MCSNYMQLLKFLTVYTVHQGSAICQKPTQHERDVSKGRRNACSVCPYSQLRPVKLNMPICSVMCSQVPGVPRPWSLAFSWALIIKTLPAMVFTLSFLEGTEKELQRYLCACKRILLQCFQCSLWRDVSCAVPFSEELGWIKSDGNNASSLRRWVRPSGPDNLLHLGQNSLQVVCVPSHNGQVAHTLIWWDKHTSHMKHGCSHYSI